MCSAKEGVYMGKKIRIRITNKQRFVGFVSFLIVISVVFGIFAFHLPSVMGQAKDKYVVVSVSSGDTLWEIARQYNHEDKDIREFIYEIMAENNMKTAMLNPGQEIKIPLQ